MPSATELAREALAATRRVRVASGLSADSPLCIFDLVHSHYGSEIDLRFQAVPSLEGLYVRGNGEPSLIILSSLRPAGRQRFTCAHELGHHYFGHGTRLDELATGTRTRGFDPTEFLADSFASFLLMPKLAVLKAFASRDLTAATASPVDVFRIATLFGVGYSTLVHHLSRTLNVMDGARASALLKSTPKTIRERFIGPTTTGSLLLVDSQWVGRAIDAAVGDQLLLPSGTLIEGDNAALHTRRHDGDLYEAVRPGIGRIEHRPSQLANYVRVARREYSGRGMFRHEEEHDE